MVYVISGLEINFLKHWPRRPPTPKIWWSCAISGGPDRIFKIVSEYKTQNSIAAMYTILGFSITIDM